MAIYKIKEVFDEVHMERVAKFDILDIEVPLKRFEEYHGEEEVRDFYSRVGALLRAYKQPPLGKTNNSPRVTEAVCLSLKSELWKHIYIIHEPFKDEMERCIILGHEETHAIEALEHLDSLERKIYNEGLRLKSWFWLDKESRANIGGICALLKRGYSAKEIKDRFVEESPGFLLMRSWFFGKLPKVPNFEKYITA